jgi:hypothetical protein
MVEPSFEEAFGNTSQKSGEVGAEATQGVLPNNGCDIE